LVELLVVIAIIGLLSSVALSNFTTARIKARNVQRASDLKQIQLALEMYYDQYGSYPSTSTWRSQCAAWGSYASTDVIPGLVPTYLAKLPADPSMDTVASVSCYLYYSNGVDYAVLDHNTSDGSYDQFPDLLDPARDGGSDACTLDGTTYWSFKVSTPTGQCW
jgi:type II secretory pathway pseudopilin PulG